MDGMNKEKWKAMTPAQKREHIWEYYKLHIIAVLCVVALAGWFIHYELTYVEPQMFVVVTNMVDLQMNDEIYHPFLEEYGYEVYDGAVSMHQNLFFDFSDNSMWESNANGMNTLMALFELGDQDLFISIEKIYATCASDGAMLDLSTVLPKELLEKYEDKLMYTRDDEESEFYPCGVKVDGNPWIEKMQKNYRGYIGIIENSDDHEMAADFIEYFLKQFDQMEGT